MADGMMMTQGAGPEILAPGEGLVRLLIADTPMSPTVRDVALPAGLSILEMLERAGVKPRMARLGVVRIDGVEMIPRTLWERVRPKPATTLVFGVRPAGGGGSLRIFLQIVLAVAIIVLIIFGQFWAAAIVAAVGNLALAFVPPPRPRVDPESTPTYAVEGGRNEARLFQPTPVVLGRRRQVLMYAARPYTEVVGDDLHLRLLLTPGVGPAQIEDIRIGSTSIAEFDQVELEVRTGAAGEPPISLITSTPVEEAPQTALSVEAGEVVRDVPGGEIDEISVDITFPRGLVRFDGRERKTAEVRFALEYRREGADWTSAFPNPIELGLAAEEAGYPRWNPGDGVTPESQASFDALVLQHIETDWRISARETSPVRRSRRWAVPRGRYQVRMRRLTPAPTDDNTVDEATWSAIRGVRAEAPRVPPNTPLLAIRIKASEQLQGQLDPISALVTSIRPVHDPATGALGAAAPTRNPADLFLAIARGPGNTRPLSANRIDFEGLAAWAQLCHARGWTADLVIDDGRSVADALASVAAAGRARPVFNRGRVSVVVDVPRDPSGQMFTPYTTRNFSFRKSFARRPHAYRVQFANEEKDYRADERIVYAPGFDAGNATEFDNLPLEPIVNADRAAEMAAYYIAVSEHRSVEYSFEMDGENAITDVGARSWLSHDAILQGLAWGRAQAWLDAAGQALPLDADGRPPVEAEVWGVALDQPIERAQGVAYGAVVRSADAARFAAVTPAAAAVVSPELRFAGALPGAALRAGDLVSFGLAGRETLEVQVRAKSRPDAQGVVTVTCEPYAHPLIDEAASADQGPWASLVRRPWAALPPRPLLNAAVWLDTGVVVDFSLPTGPEQVIAGIEARWREAADPGNPSGWLRLPDLAPADRRVTTPPPPLGAAVDLELIAYDGFGRRGPPLLVAGVEAAEPAPAPVVLGVAAVSQNGPQGSLPAIEIRTTPPTDGRTLSLLAQVRPAGGGEAAWTGLATFDPAEALHVAPAAGAPGAALEVRLRHETRRGAISAWVGPFALTLPGQVATNVLNVGGRTAAQVALDLDAAVAAADAALAAAQSVAGKADAVTVQALRDEFDAVEALVNDPNAGNAGLSSRISNESAARQTADAAVAADLDVLEAEVADARGSTASLSARVAQLDQARVNGDNALASRASALEATVNTGPNNNASLSSRATELETAVADLDAGKAEAGRVSTLEAQQGINPNLIANPTGAQGLSSWFNPGNLWQAVTLSDGRGRVFLRQLNSVTGLGEQLVSDPAVAAEAGQQYTISGYIETFGLSAGSAFAQIAFYNSSFQFIGGVFAAANPNGRFVATGQAPVGTVWLRAVINLVAVNSSAGSVVVRLLKIERGSIATPFTDDATTVATLARVTTVEQVSADAQGKTNALFGVGVYAGLSKARFQLAADGSVSTARIAADAFLIEQEIGGAVVQPLRVINGQTQINDLLVRSLQVFPNDAATLAFPLQFRPKRYSGAHGAVIALGGNVGGMPLIQPVITSPPVVGAGETWDIRAINPTGTQFTVRAVKLTPGSIGAQSSGSGSNIGGTPAWRADKPTAADAYDGNYTFTFAATIPLVDAYQTGETDELGQEYWVATYSGGVDVYVQTASGWLYLYTETLFMDASGFFLPGVSPDATASASGSTTAQYSGAIGQRSGGEREFGLHARPGVTLTGFSGVTYSTQTTSNETALTGNWAFDVYPPAS